MSAISMPASSRSSATSSSSFPPMGASGVADPPSATFEWLPTVTATRISGADAGLSRLVRSHRWDARNLGDGGRVSATGCTRSGTP
jgi:hypothetical protein